MYTPDDLVPKLEPFVDGQVWTARAPLRFYGVPMGCRMTVCRLGDGRLLVHSPIPLDAPGSTLRADLDALGTPDFVVAPNFIHHLFAAPFLAAHPDARLFVSPRLESKRPDLPFEGVLGDSAPPGTWGDTLEQALCRGSRVMDEVVFLHRPARTLILCDLLESCHRHDPRWLRIGGRLAGIYERPGPPIDMKLSFRDKPAARRFVERVLDWDFDRVVLSHGDLIGRGGKDVFRRAYAFCLG